METAVKAPAGVAETKPQAQREILVSNHAGQTLIKVRDENGDVTAHWFNEGYQPALESAASAMTRALAFVRPGDDLTLRCVSNITNHFRSPKTPLLDAAVPAWTLVQKVRDDVKSVPGGRFAVVGVGYTSLQSEFNDDLRPRYQVAPATK
jgi:hypothetical protein